MSLDTQAQAMAHGEALLEAPVGELIYRVAASIAEAQLKLDQVGVRVATLLSDTRVPFQTQDGTTSKKSLLELGFVPPFYSFTETEIEVKMTLNLKIQDDTKLEGKLDIGDDELGTAKRAVPVGVTASAENHRKFEFDMSGMSSVRTRLVAIPAPSVFIDTIKEHARATAVPPEPTPAPDPAPEPEPTPEPEPAPEPAPDPEPDPAPEPDPES